jgi:NAD(P)H-nitrite reductase large subunit
MPPIKGREKEGVFTVRYETDIQDIRHALLKAKRAVIIGGGVIGLEIAAEMKKENISVTVIEVANTIMERLLDAGTALTLQKSIESMGIVVVTGAKISEIEGNERANCVALEDGSKFPTDIVVVSAGIKPNIQIAQQAGIVTGRSIIVNEFMETSASDVYACGDCAECLGVNTGTWMQSILQGECAGANAAGDRMAYQSEPNPIIFQTAGTSLFSIGDMGKTGEKDYEIRSQSSRIIDEGYSVNIKTCEMDAYAAYCYLNEKLVGASMIGDLSHLEFIQDAVVKQVSKTTFYEMAAKRGVLIDE